MQQITQEWVKKLLKTVFICQFMYEWFIYIVHMEICSACAQFKQKLLFTKKFNISIQMVTNHLHKFVLVS